MTLPGPTMRETAFQTIKQGIVNGVWAGGTFLSEKKLSEQLQMSKTPIRSALDRLEAVGLIKLVPNQGFVVQEISMKKIMEIYELRLSLETFAANHLTGKMGPEFFERLDAILAEQAAATEQEDIVRYVDLDRQFHESIILGMDNEEYAEAMARIQDKFIMAVRTTFYRNKARLWGSLDEHRQIRSALAESDPAKTVNLVAHHIQFVEQIML